MPRRMELEMSNNKKYITTNIYGTDPLETCFESSTDSAAAPIEHQVPTHTATAETARGQQQAQQASKQDNAVHELMKQLLDLSRSELQQAAARNASGLAQLMREAYNAHENPALYPQPPPRREPPPPTACITIIQTWKKQLARHPERERTLRERFRMPADATKQSSN